jgi:predicted membrane protein
MLEYIVIDILGSVTFPGMSFKNKFLIAFLFLNTLIILSVLVIMRTLYFIKHYRKKKRAKKQSTSDGLTL